MAPLQNRPVVIISCKVLEDAVAPLATEFGAEVRFMEYGLHRFPPGLRERLQQEIDSIAEPSVILLGYGLCGNGLVGIEARQHTIVMPRVDDCISLFLGSREIYISEFRSEPGTYYLSKGWLEVGSDPLHEYERYVTQYGPEEALWLMDEQYRNYRRLVLVAHTERDLEECRPRALRVAAFGQRWAWRYEERLGTDGFIRELAMQGRDPEGAPDRFLVVPPGGKVHEVEFRR